jgi:hypothetical protein
VALATVSLTLSAAIFLKWATLPYSELLTVFWGIALAVMTARATRSAGSGPWAFAGFLAGCAMVTRPTAVFYAVLAPAVALHYTGSVVRDWRKLFVYAAPAVLLPCVYLAAREIAASHALPYLGEWQRRESDMIPPVRFIESLTRFFRLPDVAVRGDVMGASLVLNQVFYYAALVISLRGFAGRMAGTAAWALVAFLAAHSTWNYSSERFNVLVLPLAALVVARGVEWLIDRDSNFDTFSRAKAAAFCCVVAFVCMIQCFYAVDVIDDHIDALRRGTGKPREMARVANSNPRGAWVELGPEFAYYFDGTTYFDHDEPFFYRRTAANKADHFEHAHIAWVVTRSSPEEWFARHPDLTTGSISLRRETGDGIWTLYRVVPTGHEVQNQESAPNAMQPGTH